MRFILILFHSAFLQIISLIIITHSYINLNMYTIIFFTCG